MTKEQPLVGGQLAAAKAHREQAKVSLSIELATLEEAEELVSLCRRCGSALLAQGIDQWDEVYPSLADFQEDIAAGTLYRARINAQTLDDGETEEQDTAEEESRRECSGSSRSGDGAAGEIVGCVVLNEDADPEYDDIEWIYHVEAREGRRDDKEGQAWKGKPAIVHRLMVLPEYQGQGIASILMDFIQKRAKDLGYTVMRLDTFTQNPASVSFYRKRGFREAGTVIFRKGEFYCYEKKL